MQRGDNQTMKQKTSTVKKTSDWAKQGKEPGVLLGMSSKSLWKEVLIPTFSG